MRSPITIAGAACVAFAVITAWVGPLLWARDAAVWGPASAEANDPNSLVDQLERATVSYGDHRCEQWTGNRWDCGLKAWLWVGRYPGQATTHKGPERRTCIYAHPKTENDKPVPLTVDFGDVAPGTAFFGEAALLDVPRTGGPASIKVMVDGRQRTVVRLTDEHGRKWVPWRVETANAKPVRLAFEITARKADWRQVCFTAFIEKDGEGAE